MTEQTQYPAISDKLINCLEKDYIDQLPTRTVTRPATAPQDGRFVWAASG